MRDKEETFVFGPKEFLSQELVDTRMDFLVQRMNSLEDKVNKISEMLTELFERVKPSGNILEVRTQKSYGFEPGDRVD